MISVRNTKSGRRYDVRLRDPSGRVYTRTFTTKRDAETFTAQERADRSRGAWVDPRRGTMTLDDWSEHWLAQRPELRMRTRELYRGLLDHHILPELGQVELAKLSPSQVRSWYARLQGEDGPGPSAAAKAYRLLRAIMRTAVADEMVLRNPCQVERAGVERSPERPVATIAEVVALADAIAPRFRTLVLLSAWCGLRRGELFALRRSDFDPLRNTLRVERAMQQLANAPSSSVLRVRKPAVARLPSLLISSLTCRRTWNCSPAPTAMRWSSPARRVAHSGRTSSRRRGTRPSS